MSNPPLGRWSFQDIMKIYGILGKQLQEYDSINSRINIPRAVNISFTDDDNVFIGRFWQEVTRLNDQILELDKEIARRNSLIGVIG